MEEGKEVASLKEWRLRKHWTYAQLAKAADVSTETLQRGQRGGKLHELTQRKIADALGVRVGQVAEFVESAERAEGDRS